MCIYIYIHVRVCTRVCVCVCVCVCAYAGAHFEKRVSFHCRGKGVWAWFILISGLTSWVRVIGTQHWQKAWCHQKKQLIMFTLSSTVCVGVGCLREQSNDKQILLCDNHDILSFSGLMTVPKFWMERYEMILSKWRIFQKTRLDMVCLLFFFWLLENHPWKTRIAWRHQA